MRKFLSRITNTSWLYEHRAKFGGFAFGTLGAWTIALFITVVITGDPVGGDPRPVEQVYFIE